MHWRHNPRNSPGLRLGIEEFEPRYLLAGNSTEVRSDINGDFEVGYADFLILSAQFGTAETDADFDGDGNVAFADFLILAQEFGAKIEPEYLVGDWDGDGTDNLAVRVGTKVYMDFDFDDDAERRQEYGVAGDVYLVGDWDGDGADNLAVRRGNEIFMDFDFDGVVDRTQIYGVAGDAYLVGDWDGDGVDNLAVRRGNEIFMDFDFDGVVDRTQIYGAAGDAYLVGDWDGDGVDNVAIHRRGNQFLMDFDFDDDAERSQQYGIPGDDYLVGDWDGDGADNLAARRGHEILMDYDFAFDGLVERIQEYGETLPILDASAPMQCPATEWLTDVHSVVTAVESAVPGDVVCVGDGDYDISSVLPAGRPLRIDAPMSLISQSENVRFSHDLQTGNGESGIVLDIRASEVTILGGTFDNNDVDGNRYAAIRVGTFGTSDAVNDVTIDGVRIRNFRRPGLGYGVIPWTDKGGSIDNLTVQNSLFEGNRHGVTSTTDSTITNYRILNNRFMNHEGSSIDTHRGVVGVEVIGNEIEQGALANVNGSPADGIHMRSTVGLLIKGNTIVQNAASRSGIVLSYEAASLPGRRMVTATISDNNINGISVNGIVVSTNNSGTPTDLPVNVMIGPNNSIEGTYSWSIWWEHPSGTPNNCKSPSFCVKDSPIPEQALFNL